MRRNLRRNYVAHLLHGLFGQTGFRLVTTPTFIPLYVSSISGGSAVWVGVARSAQALGQCLSPLFSATVIEHRRRVLPVALRVGNLVRAQVLGLALAGFFLGAAQNLIAVCVFLGLFGFFMGMQGVAFNFLMAKVIPVDVRGRLSGLRNALAGLTSAGVGFLSGAYFVEHNILGNGYAAAFLLAFVLTELGLVAMMFLREPETPEVRERTGMSRLRDLPALVRGDANFAVFLAACMLGGFGRMALPYYVLYAAKRLDLERHDAGPADRGVPARLDRAEPVLGLARRSARVPRGVPRLARDLDRRAPSRCSGSTATQGLVWVFVAIGTGFGGQHDGPAEHGARVRRAFETCRCASAPRTR